MAAVKLFACDLSGVITEEAPHSVTDFAKYCSLSTIDWLLVYRQYCDVERAWDRVERGETALSTFAMELVRRIEEAGGQCSITDALALWGRPDPFSACVRIRTEVLDLVTKLRSAGCKSCLCTNNVAEWRAVWRQLLPVSDFFDYAFDSSEMGVRKPEPSFFERIERETGCVGNEVLLVDDRPENVIAAKQFGWRAILFAGNTEEVTRALEAELNCSFVQEGRMSDG